jgi:aminopeptidase N
MKNTLFVFLMFLATPILSQENHPELFKSLRQNDFKGDINMYYNPLMDKYDVYFVKLDLEVSDQTTNISGNTTLLVTATQALDTLLFDSPVAIGENIKAQVYYHGTPDPNGGGVSQDYDSQWSKNVTWTLSESFHAMEWWPCKQVMSDKIDSVYMFFTCDDDCMVGSNGILDHVVDLPNNKKRFEWKSYYPINYYLLSFAVAEYQDYSIYSKPEGVDSILIQNFVYNNSNYLSSNQADIDKTIDLIELFSDKFGLYPFSEEKYGHCLTTLGGGMEHQTMTTLGNFGFLLVAHELGHMWFGDYVTCATWQDIWINEGFASYSEYISLENLATENDTQEWLNDANSRALGEPHGSVYIPFSEAFSESRIFNYSLSYRKGALLLHMLRHEINDDEVFFSSLQNYLSEYADSVATGDDFKNSIELSTNMDFDPFFEQWYYGKGFPKFSIGYTQMNDTLFMTVTETTSSSEPELFQMHVEYKIVHENGDTTVRFYQSENVETFEIPMSETVSNIIVDPDNWILNQVGTIDSVVSPGNDKSLFSIYPNPAIETLNIRFNEKLYRSDKTIEILDVTGKRILKYNSQSNVIPVNISFLSKGIYFIRGTSSNKAYTYKFIKQ